MVHQNNARTMTVSAKVTAYEKMRYEKIAESHNISFSEWAASILNIYQNAYGELRINSYREDELLAKIDKLEKEVNLLQKLTDFQNITKGIKNSGYEY
jgi:hypothetical protein